MFDKLETDSTNNTFIFSAKLAEYTSDTRSKYVCFHTYPIPEL